MRKGLKKALKVAGLVVGGVAVLAFIAVLLVLFDKPLVRGISQKYITKTAGFPVQIGGMDYTLFPLHLILTDVTATYKTPILTMDVNMKRLEAAGSLGKLFKRDNPALDAVSVDLAELRFNQTEISPEPIDFAGIIRKTAAILAYTRHASIRCERMPLSVRGQDFTFLSLSVELSRASGPDVYNIRLASENATVAMPAEHFSLEAPLRIDGTLTLANAAAAALRLALGNVQVSAAGRREGLKDVVLDLNGTWDIAGKKVRLPKLGITVPGLVTAAASGSAELGDMPTLDASVAVRFEDLASLTALLGPSLPSGLRNAQARGRIRFDGKCSIRPPSSAPGSSLESVIELDDVGLAFARAGLALGLEISGTLKTGTSRLPPLVAPAAGSPATLAGLPLEASFGIDRLVVHAKGAGLPPLALDISGTVEATGTYPDLKGSADIRSSIGPVSQGNLEVRGTTLRLEASGTRQAAEVSRLDATLAGVSASFPGGKTLALEKIEIAGAGRADLVRKSAAISSLEVKLPALAPLLLSGRFDPSPRGLKQAHLESRNQTIPALRALLGPFLPAGLADWEADGSLTLVLDAKKRIRPSPGWDLSGEIGLAGLKFNDPSFTVAGDGLSPRLLVLAAAEPSTGGVSWSSSLELSQGESLWKDVYISWAKNPLRAELAGRYDPGRGVIDGLSAKFDFPTIGTLQADGQMSLGAVPSFDLKARATLGLEPLYSLYSQSGVPPENRLRLGGELSADLEVRKSETGTAVDGRVTLDAPAIENPAAKLTVHGLAVDLPVHLRVAGSPGPGPGAPSPGNPGAPSDKGFIRIQEIRTTQLTINPPALNVLGGPNAYRLEPFAIDLFGGRLEFGETALGLDPGTSSFHGTSSLRLPALDLSRLPVASAQVPLTGSVAVDLPVLDISPAEITTQGRIGADIFGGRVVVSNLAVSDPLAKGRAISCDVELVDLDLKKVTDVIPFGEMTGIIKGEIQGLTISYGQPESFVLNIESVKRKGVPQTFSLKAVDNLTVLSSGQKASAGGGQFFMRFIRGFRYAKIGIRSTLRNDTFTLNGTIHERGVEYLVKKPALFGINVINRMPDKKISFKEMMSRLERVGQSEAPTEQK